MLGALILLALIQLPLAWWLARRVRREPARAGGASQPRDRGVGRRAAADRARPPRRRRPGSRGVVVLALGRRGERACSVRRRAARGGRRDETRDPPAAHPARRDLSARAPPRRASRRRSLTCSRASEAHGIETDARRRSRRRTGPRDRGALLPGRAGSAAQRDQARRRDACRGDGRAEERPSRNSSSRTTAAVSIPGSPDANGHFGLRMLEDLVRDSAGKLEIDSTPGAGSRVSVEVAA